MSATRNVAVLTTLVALVGCTEPAPPDRVGAPSVSPIPTLPASTAALDASIDGAASAPAGTGGGREAEASTQTADLAAAMLERRTFRHLLVGALRFPPKRLTWVLFRSATRARLQVFCQVGKPTSAMGISLTGKENDETLWRTPILTEYAGTRTGGDSGADLVAYRLSVTSGPVGETGCEALPSVLRLQCRPEQVSVLAPGAALVPGKKLPDDRITPARWQPPGSERAAALRCDILMESEPAKWPFHQVLRDWSLVFVAGRAGMPGIEWAHENSDQVAQEGAYRWMPAPE